jgi:hypothetical protein
MQLNTDNTPDGFGDRLLEHFGSVEAAMEFLDLEGEPAMNTPKGVPVIYVTQVKGGRMHSSRVRKILNGEIEHTYITQPCK